MDKNQSTLQGLKTRFHSALERLLFTKAQGSETLQLSLCAEAKSRPGEYYYRVLSKYFNSSRRFFLAYGQLSFEIYAKSSIPMRRHE